MSMRWIIDIYGWDGWTQYSQILLTLFVSLREEKDYNTLEINSIKLHTVITYNGVKSNIVIIIIFLEDYFVSNTLAINTLLLYYYKHIVITFNVSYNLIKSNIVINICLIEKRKRLRIKQYIL
jgi:hypothetical protein